MADGGEVITKADADRQEYIRRAQARWVKEQETYSRVLLLSAPLAVLLFAISYWTAHYADAPTVLGTWRSTFSLVTFVAGLGCAGTAFGSRIGSIYNIKSED